MKILMWFLFAYSAINIANVEAGGKSMVIYIKDGSNSNELVSVEVDKDFYSTILQQINLKNKKTKTVDKMNSSKDFLTMVSGGNCKCQCLCCDDPDITTPPSSTISTTTTSRPEKITTTRTTTKHPITTNSPTRTTTRSTTRYTTKHPITTNSPTRTTQFVGPTYLPPATVSTTKRPSTTTRTYSFVSRNIIVYGNYTTPPWTSRKPKSRRTPVITTTPKYAYYKPKDAFYYPGEGLQDRLEEGGKVVWAVEPVSLNQNIAQPNVLKNKWNFLS